MRFITLTNIKIELPLENISYSSILLFLRLLLFLFCKSDIFVDIYHWKMHT